MGWALIPLQPRSLFSVIVHHLGFRHWHLSVSSYVTYSHSLASRLLFHFKTHEDD
jgi:hypothetical protein